MTMPEPDPGAQAAATPAEIASILFASLLMQQANMALVFLGRVPHPQTGQKTLDLEAAQHFIDTLDMLEAKTKGNLSPQERQLLQDNLTNLRMYYVEAATAASPTPSAASPASGPDAPAPAAAHAPASPSAPGAPETDEEARKKFVKKY